MHSESEIRRAIRPLLDQYGQLNTSEIKKHLPEVLIYDKEDEKKSGTRNEMLIVQRIGNIVAHQTDSDKKEYEEGFFVDKSVKPAVFIAVDGLNEKKKPITHTEIKRRNKKAEVFKAIKIDWGKKRERDDEVGALGEEFVLEFEKDRVATFDKTSVSRVIHYSRVQGDGLGYDIGSVNSDGTAMRIEVKTTSGDVNTPFYMSKTEKAFFEIYKNDGAYIYRVYNFDKDTRRGEILVISATELLTILLLIPNTHVKQLVYIFHLLILL